MRIYIIQEKLQKLKYTAQGHTQSDRTIAKI